MKGSALMASLAPYYEDELVTLWHGLPSAVASDE